MKRLLVGLVLLCAPMVGQAQYLQNITTSEYSLRTLLTKETNVSYLYQIEFRNEQLFDPAKIFFITDVLLGGVAGNSGPFAVGQHETYLPSQTTGAVYKGSFSSTPAPLTYFTGWFDNLNPGGYSMRFGRSMTSSDITNGAGLLGCGAPAINIGGVPGTHAGSTCASAGYTGWEQISVRITFDSPTPSFAGASLNAGVVGFFKDRAAITTVPEPSTWLLMGAGLLAIGVARRRRPTPATTTESAAPAPGPDNGRPSR